MSRIPPSRPFTPKDGNSIMDHVQRALLSASDAVQSTSRPSISAEDLEQIAAAMSSPPKLSPSAIDDARRRGRAAAAKRKVEADLLAVDAEESAPSTSNEVVVPTHTELDSLRAELEAAKAREQATLTAFAALAEQVAALRSEVEGLRAPPSDGPSGTPSGEAPSVPFSPTVRYQFDARVISITVEGHFYLETEGNTRIHLPITDTINVLFPCGTSVGDFRNPDVFRHSDGYIKETLSFVVSGKTLNDLGIAPLGLMLYTPF